MNILGISAFYHNSAAALVSDGVVLAMAEEERFSRIKFDAAFPTKAVSYCLRAGALTPLDIDVVAFYERPIEKFGRQLATAAATGNWHSFDPAKHPPLVAEEKIRQQLAYDREIQFVGHHESHAASAFFCCGNSHAALIVADAVGEWATLSTGVGVDQTITLQSRAQYPHSLGLFYSSITAYLGFGVNDGEYKVMGMAAYGKPVYLDKMRSMVKFDGDSLTLEMSFFDYFNGGTMYSPKFVEEFGPPRLDPSHSLEKRHFDLAASAQYLTEEIMLAVVENVRMEYPLPTLCMSGGVALNSVVNGAVARSGMFKRVFVPPAAGDAGGALGAALYVGAQVVPAPAPLNFNVFSGTEYSSDEIEHLLINIGITFEKFAARDELVEKASEILAYGKILGWFCGRMEFGPRALGARSILADPRCKDMKDYLNSKIKRREQFRPFGPAVLAEYTSEYFDSDDSPYMLFTAQCKLPHLIPAVVHLDGSSRLQTVGPTDHLTFRMLLQAFLRRTGCPVLLNTSFNMKDEPIVESPYDALKCFARAQLDALVLEDFLIIRNKVDPAWLMFNEREAGIAPDSVKSSVYDLL